MKSMRVGKRYLVISLTEKGFSEKDAEKAVTGVMDAIVLALRCDMNVSLSNIGTLRRETLKGETAWNPLKGEHVARVSPETVRWTCSPTLKDVLNGRSDRESLASKLPKGSLR